MKTFAALLLFLISATVDIIKWLLILAVLPFAIVRNLFKSEEQKRADYIRRNGYD